MSGATVDEIFEAVSAWPAQDRLSLAYRILQSVTPRESVSASEKSAALQRLRGLLARDNTPPPTDEDVARWLDEHREEKYG
ncbi:MAG: hypothetical protein OJF49_002594 [Ktedonobacterales bacterium]|jgi:hypothetical protein|nr:MAG: hypothetical protein OJF49_002594 [Ktedonobacterales bacterium]